jgi:hypothetical protein
MSGRCLWSGKGGRAIARNDSLARKNVNPRPCCRDGSAPITGEIVGVLVISPDEARKLSYGWP